MQAPVKNLSPREREIVTRLANGDHQKAIAADLGISTRTVEVFISRARLKVRAKTTIQLVFICCGFPLRDSA